MSTILQLLLSVLWYSVEKRLLNNSLKKNNYFYVTIVYYGVWKLSIFRNNKKKKINRILRARARSHTSHTILLKNSVLFHTWREKTLVTSGEPIWFFFGISGYSGIRNRKSKSGIKNDRYVDWKHYLLSVVYYLDKLS